MAAGASLPIGKGGHRSSESTMVKAQHGGSKDGLSMQALPETARPFLQPKGPRPIEEGHLPRATE